MTDIDVISLSSDSSRPSSPFINISEVLNDTEKRESTGISSKEQTIISPMKNRVVHALSESDDSELETESRTNTKGDIINEKFYSCKPNNFIKQLSLPVKSNSDVENHIGKEDDDDTTIKYYRALYSEVPKEDFSVQLQENNPSTSKKYTLDDLKNKESYPGNKIKMSKEQRLEEKLRKQKEKELIRAEKLATKELQNQIKPNNCMKYMTVILDSALISCPFSGTLIAAVQNSESKYEVSAQAVPLTVSWRREMPGPNIMEEKDVLLVWQWELVIPEIKHHSLSSKVQDIQAHHPGKCLFLIIYGLNGYFSYLKNKRRYVSSDPPKAKKGKRSSENEEFPYITKKEIEEELIELQISTNCTHRLIESPEDLGNFVIQVTKAIAETPFKLDKQKRVQENLEWFAVGDSRDCVAVDKAGNGLLRLWQQQLCQFNLAGHDVAQAIAAVYPSPLSIVRAYDSCSSQKECEDLLKDIPVRRCQGPLTSSRRIGPELSKKIYTFFRATDGDTPLSQEQ
uniref:Uncharacterized protein n=1 Tax=Graphocephala atropunctata TaxID=36148 RepID=A0A1B6L704_9HEMI